MKKKFLIHYRLYGTITVEAENRDQAEEMVYGVKGPAIITDQQLIDGIPKDVFNSNIDCQIEGDSIEVYDIEEVEK